MSSCLTRRIASTTKRRARLTLTRKKDSASDPQGSLNDHRPERAMHNMPIALSIRERRENSSYSFFISHGSHNRANGGGRRDDHSLPRDGSSAAFLLLQWYVKL